MSVHARIDSSGYIHLLWESNEDRNGHAAIFEVKFGKTSERAVKESRERSVEQLFPDLESVALAVEGRELDTTEDPNEPSARYINDTKKRQLVTRSGLPRLRCCVCHVHHKWAVQSTAADREFFNTVLQQVCHFKVDAIAGDANAAAYKYDQKQEYQDLHDSSVAVMLERDLQREVNEGHPFQRRLHIDYSTNNHPTQLDAANDIDCCFVAILSYGKPAVPRIMRKLWSNLKPNHSVNFCEQITDLRE